MKNRIGLRLPFFLFLSIVCFTNIKAQNEARFWQFGTNAGLDFSTIPPSSISSSINTSEGCASISSASGNLLFYTDGLKVYDQTNAVMQNGTGLFGDGSSTQSAIIVKQPGNLNLYYIFTQDDVAGINGHCYSIVDMSLAAGMGSVTIKNVNIYTPSCEKITAVRHCNGVDVWILSHEYPSNIFRAYLLTSAGLSATPVLSPIGSIVNTINETLGQMKVSPLGNKIGIAVYGPTVTNAAVVFDFDPSNGVVSNSLSLGSFGSAYGCEFSNDGSKFYVGQFTGSQFFQWDLCAGTPSAVVNSKVTFTVPTSAICSFQLGPDGKIYIARNTATLSVIDSPNITGTGCNFIPSAITLTTGIGRLGLPNFINSFFKTTPAPFTYTTSCLKVDFSSLQLPGQASSGCSSVSNSVQSLTWNFGNPQSGLSNVATGSLVTHNYTALGTYTVKLAINYNCNTDTVVQTVTVQNNSAPTILVAGPQTICLGDTRIYTGLGAQTYTWSNGTTQNTIALSPTVSTGYSVAGTSSNICSGTKTFTIAVAKCTDIVVQEQELMVVSGSNPFDEKITIYLNSACSVSLLDSEGTVFIDKQLEPGTQILDTKNLKDGIYTLVLNGAGRQTKKMVKIKGSVDAP